MMVKSCLPCIPKKLQVLFSNVNVDCQDLFLCISLSTGTVLFDTFQRIKLDLCLCCKVNIHSLVILVHHSTKNHKFDMLKLSIRLVDPQVCNNQI